MLKAPGVERQPDRAVGGGKRLVPSPESRALISQITFRTRDEPPEARLRLAPSAKKRTRASISAKSTGQTIRVLKRLIADKERAVEGLQHEIDELQACVDGLEE